jgi:SAM-dependent methyltransferase
MLSRVDDLIVHGITASMSEPPPPGARVSPWTARNRDPILEVLKAHLPSSGLVLEAAAGAGEHAACFAAAFPGLTWLPTDPDPEALASIAAWRGHIALPNLLAPVRLDVAAPEPWPVSKAQGVVNINMIHISPWAATEGLMAGAGRILPKDGVLFLYGPYFEDGVAPAPSNLAFDQSLKSRNRAWGIRRREDVEALAARHDLQFTARVAMPANNLSLVFRKAA